MVLKQKPFLARLVKKTARQATTKINWKNWASNAWWAGFKNTQRWPRVSIHVNDNFEGSWGSSVTFRFYGFKTARAASLKALRFLKRLGYKPPETRP
jgi:hypothetical protein